MLLLFIQFGHSIVHWEMLNILEPFRVLGKYWTSSQVLFYRDKAAVLQVADSGKTRDLLSAACLRNI